MSDAPRYAVYFAPGAATPLGDFGAGVLGYDARTGEECALHASLQQAYAAWRDVVAEPARYGFHATLKAPFELAAGVSEAALLAAVRDLAASLRPIGIGTLGVAEISSFVALVPASRVVARDLSQTVVEQLDPLRAPLSRADRNRRLLMPLSLRQVEYLDRWGYPYVAEEFRFHMTLTGPLELVRLRKARAILDELYAPCSAPISIDALAIFHQPQRNRPFVEMARFELGGGTAEVSTPSR